jgi:hypothetical protein
MPYRPPRKFKKSGLNAGAADSSQVRAQQLLDQRRRDLATRSTLSRLRNRKSDLK